MILWFESLKFMNKNNNNKKQTKKNLCKESYWYLFIVYLFFNSLLLSSLVFLLFFLSLNPNLIIPFLTDQVQGTVTIRNISALSSGLYQCVASNAIGTSTCLLDLQVISRKYIKVWCPLWVWNTKISAKLENEEFCLLFFFFLDCLKIK